MYSKAKNRYASTSAQDLDFFVRIQLKCKLHPVQFAALICSVCVAQPHPRSITHRPAVFTISMMKTAV